MYVCLSLFRTSNIPIHFLICSGDVSCVLKSVHWFTLVDDLFVVDLNLDNYSIFYSSIIGEIEIKINCLKQEKK